MNFKLYHKRICVFIEYNNIGYFMSSKPLSSSQARWAALFLVSLTSLLHTVPVIDIAIPISYQGIEIITLNKTKKLNN